MTLSVTHSYVSSIGETTPSGGPGGTVGPTEWNANHTLTGTVSPAQGGTGITSGLGVTYFSSATVIADSGTLSTNQLVVGGGPNGAPATIGSLGTTSQVLHGNASGNPSFGAVNLASEVAGILSTGNLQTATTAVFGIVKPDNSSITISSGIITATASVAGSSGQIQYNAGASALGGISFTNTNGQTLTTIRLSTTTSLDWQTSSTSSGVDVSLYRQGPGELALSSTAASSPQALWVYNTNDNNVAPANYERAAFDWVTSANVLTIGTQKAGTGSGRDLNFVGGALNVSGSQNSNIGTITTGYIDIIATAQGVLRLKSRGNASHFGAIAFGLEENGGFTQSPVYPFSIQYGDGTQDIWIGIGQTYTGLTGNQFSGGQFMFKQQFAAPGVLQFRLADDSGGGWMNWGGEGRVAANVTSTTTSLANIAGLTATLASSRTYSFRAELIATCSSSGGIQIGVNSTSTGVFTILMDGYAIDGGNTVRGYSQQTAFGSAIIGTTITNTTLHAHVWGTITTSGTAGPVNVQMSQQNLSATQTIAQRGSYLLFHDNP